MGLETAQGLLLPGIFYWDMNDRTRAFTKRFLPKTPDNYPSDLHAACYSATTHYLKAAVALGVEKAKTSGLDAINWMKAVPSPELNRAPLLCGARQQLPVSRNRVRIGIAGCNARPNLHRWLNCATSSQLTCFKKFFWQAATPKRMSLRP